MNSRILDLISSPDLIAETDLSLLKEEISKQPYAQSLRALYLLGTKKFDDGNFQKELSVTAAYTTDKKILYQLINGKIFEPSRPEVVKEEKISSEGDVLPQEIPAGIPEENNSIVEQALEKDEKISSEGAVLHQEMTASIPEENHSIVEQALEKQEQKPALSSRIPEGNWLAAIPKPPIPKKVITEGEVNRILFPGEENFLNEEPTEKIDLEATAETGVLVTEKINPVAAPVAELQTFDTEKEEANDIEKVAITNENAAQSEGVKNEDELEENSQNQLENDAEKMVPADEVLFLEKDQNEMANAAITKTEEALSPLNLNAQEAAPELEKEEVSETEENVTSKNAQDSGAAFQKENQQDQELQEELLNTAEVNFHREESFMADIHLNPSKKQDLRDLSFETKKEVQVENKYELERKRLTEEIEQKMALDKKSQLPLSENAEQTEVNPEFLQPSEVSAEDQTGPEKPTDSEKEEESAAQEVEAFSNDKTEMRVEDEISPLHISFFADDVSNLNPEKNIKEDEAAIHVQPSEPIESNIPTFINTWQNWLKIDRTKTEVAKNEEAEKADLKAEVIEKFLVAAPKISRFKEDGTYTVQEKKDDISHLMTETLANLFWSQKLYSKAINGYHNLSAKHPEKEEYYLNQIQEILASRQK